MKKGNYKVRNGKVHLHEGKRDYLRCNVYACGLRMLDHQPVKSGGDELTESKLTCKKCKAVQTKLVLT